MLERLDELVFGRGKLFIYILGIFLIVYFDKWNLIKVLQLVLVIGQITAIWFVIKILRIYLIDYVVKFNKFMYKYVVIIIKLRKYVVDIPLLLRIILSLFIYIDKFLIKIFFLGTRKRNWFYFFRRFLYLNLLICITLPFYFIKELYGIILVVIELNQITLKDIFLLRAHFLFLTIICVLLVDIERIDFLIAAWIIDTIIINVYYEWWKWWKQMYVLKEFNLRVYNINLQSAFNQVRMNYNEYCNSFITDLSPLRKRVILLYKGLTDEEINSCRIVSLDKLIGRYNFWWNNNYSKYIINISNFFDYYDSNNDEQFILLLLARIIEIIGDEKDNTVKIFDKLLYDSLEETFDINFYPRQYILVKNLVEKLKKKENLIIKFYELNKKYDFGIYEDFTNNEDVKKFFEELNS